MEKRALISMNVSKHQAYVRNIVQTHRAVITVNVTNAIMNGNRMSTHANAKIVHNHGSYSQTNTTCETCQPMVIK